MNKRISNLLYAIEGYADDPLFDLVYFSRFGDVITIKLRDNTNTQKEVKDDATKETLPDTGTVHGIDYSDPSKRCACDIEL